MLPYYAVIGTEENRDVPGFAVIWINVSVPVSCEEAESFGLKNSISYETHNSPIVTPPYCIPCVKYMNAPQS
jgi:hypothetical protein